MEPANTPARRKIRLHVAVCLGRIVGVEPAPQPERRRLQRTSLQGRVTGHYGNDAIHKVTGTSKDVSAEGMFVFFGADVPVKSRVELLLELPTVDVFKNKLGLRCVGRVVRVEGVMPDGTFGVAVAFENIEISSRA